MESKQEKRKSTNDQAEQDDPKRHRVTIDSEFKNWTFAKWTAKYEKLVWAHDAPIDREDEQGHHLCPFCDLAYGIDYDDSNGFFSLPDHLRECKSPAWHYFKDKFMSNYLFCPKTGHFDVYYLVKGDLNKWSTSNEDKQWLRALSANCPNTCRHGKPDTETPAALTRIQDWLKAQDLANIDYEKLQRKLRSLANKLEPWG